MMGGFLTMDFNHVHSVQLALYQTPVKVVALLVLLALIQELEP